jgi:superfamily II DNA helicase RecQ
MGVSGIKMYHAGMSADDRKGELAIIKLTMSEVQDWFMNGDKGVVCATIAFAMGIDKNNVRQIHHLMLPKSVESWRYV